MAKQNQVERFLCIVSRVSFPFGTAAGSGSANEKEALAFGWLMVDDISFIL